MAAKSEVTINGGTDTAGHNDCFIARYAGIIIGLTLTKCFLDQGSSRREGPVPLFQSDPVKDWQEIQSLKMNLNCPPNNK